jgi:hypothetical protein
LEEGFFVNAFALIFLSEILSTLRGRRKGRKKSRTVHVALRINNSSASTNIEIGTAEGGERVEKEGE